MTEPGVRSGRLLSLVLLLQTRRRASARQIADQLGVSVRTVYRDIEVLGRIGVPVYAETGRDGGYRLVDGYRTSFTGLTAQESLALFLIGLPAPAASLGLADQARGAEAKLLAALSPAYREQAGRLRDRFLLDLPAWYHDIETPPPLPALVDAALTDRRVQVRYRRWKEPREVSRVLEPYGLVVKNGVWYLVAGARDGERSDPRVYRVGNILELASLDEPFERRAGFELASFWGKHLADFDSRRLVDTARLRISPDLVSRLRDVGTAALRAAAESGSVDTDGWTVADLPIESPEWAATMLIGFGGDIEVVSPVAVRDALVRRARAVLDRHRAPRRP